MWSKRNKTPCVTGWKHKEDLAKETSSTETKLSDDASEYVADVKEYGGKIADAIASLTGRDTDNVFDALKGASSDESAVSILLNDQSAAEGLFKTGNSETKIAVRQLAAAQQNRGQTLSSAAVSGAKKGTNTFTLTVGGKDYDMFVNVNATDSNRTVQEKFAAAINAESKNTGVTASVIYNEKDKTSSLVLSSGKTGADSAFEIKDDSGDIVSALKADYVTTTARDALFTVNGEERVSASNEADLGNGLTATLKKVTEEDVTVSVKKDADKITNTIYDLINGFNQLREAALNQGDDSGARSLLNRLDSISSAYSTTLARAGISFNKDGYLELDKEKLAAAVENGQAENVFGKDSGFSRSLSTIAKQAETDPTRYLSLEAKRGNETSAVEDYLTDYSSLMDSTNFTARQNNQLMKLEQTSALLNTLV